MKKRLPYIVCLFFLLLVAYKYRPGMGFTELIGFGEYLKAVRMTEVLAVPHYEKPNSWGYDGQYYAFLAIDPTLKHPDFHRGEHYPTIDTPAYRARRILLPAMAYVLGWGDTSAVLNAYALLNVGFWIIFAWLLLRWLPVNTHRGLAQWAACLFCMGTLESVRLSLTDLPAVVFMAATIAFLETGRTIPAATCWWRASVVPRLPAAIAHRGSAIKYFAAVAALVLGVLTRETNILSAVVFPKKARPIWKAALVSAGVSAIALAVFFVWWLYVRSIFEPFPGVAGNLTLPFVGMWGSFVEAGRMMFVEGNFSSRYVFRIVAMLGLLGQCAYLVYNPKLDNRWWRIGIVYAVLFVCLGPSVWGGYWAITRTILPMTIAFNLLLDRNARYFWWLLIGTNLCAIHGFVRWI